MNGIYFSLKLIENFSKVDSRLTAVEQICFQNQAVLQQHQTVLQQHQAVQQQHQTVLQQHLAILQGG